MRADVVIALECLLFAWQQFTQMRGQQVAMIICIDKKLPHSPSWPPTAAWEGAYWHLLDSPHSAGRGRRRLQRRRRRRSYTLMKHVSYNHLLMMKRKVQLTVSRAVRLCFIYTSCTTTSTRNKQKGKEERDDRRRNKERHKNKSRGTLEDIQY